MKKTSSRCAFLVGGLLIASAALYQGSKASMQWPSISHLSDHDSFKTNELATELRTRRIDHRRLTSEVASAREKEPLLVSQLERLQRDCSRIESELNSARTEFEFANQRQSAFNQSLRQRTRQIGETLATLEESEKEVQARQFHEIEVARQQRDAQRGPVGTRYSAQDEALRERQLKKKSKTDSEQKIAFVRNNAVQQLDTEKKAVQASVEFCEMHVSDLTKKRQYMLDEIDSTRTRLADLRTTVKSGDQQIKKIQNDIASLESMLISLAANHSKPASVDTGFLNQDSIPRQANMNSGWSTSPVATNARSTSRAMSGSSSFQEFARGESPVSPRFDFSYRPPVGEHYVRSYRRKDGTYVRGHHRTNPDSSFWNNHSSFANVNPHNGRVGTKLPNNR